MESVSRPRLPWFKIWIWPRRTIREIVDYDPNYLVIPLAMIYGINGALRTARRESWGDDFNIVLLIAIACGVGLIVGIISLYIGGAILAWIGARLGGKASAEQVRAALAWSSITHILILTCWLVSATVYGSEAFKRYTPNLDARLEAGSFTSVLSMIVLLGVSGLYLVLQGWNIVLTICCLAEVHRFSIWRSIATLLIPILVIFGCIFIPGMLVSIYANWFTDQYGLHIIISRLHAHNGFGF